MLAAKNAKGAKKIAVLRWRCFNAEAQRRRVRRGDGRVEHVERVEGVVGRDRRSFCNR